MLTQITFFLILGKPLIMYLGIITLLLLILTASIPTLQKKGIKFLPFKYHSTLARITIGLAIVHGVLGLGIYF
ncbi:hypothetical protein GYA49_02920 [Candidatus Beckwithbacteria bacterium]|nr:hypothetical protein [Candidatus Beckwithbacteria bacterium]